MDIWFSEALINDGVARKRNSLFANLSITSFKDKFSNSLSGRITKSNIGLNFTEEIGGGFVDSDKNSVMELSQSQNSQNSDNFGVELVNNPDPYHKG